MLGSSTVGQWQNTCHITAQQDSGRTLATSQHSRTVVEHLPHHITVGQWQNTCHITAQQGSGRTLAASQHCRTVVEHLLHHNTVGQWQNTCHITTLQDSVRTLATSQHSRTVVEHLPQSLNLVTGQKEKYQPLTNALAYLVENKVVTILTEGQKEFSLKNFFFFLKKVKVLLKNVFHPPAAKLYIKL